MKWVSAVDSGSGCVNAELVSLKVLEVVVNEEVDVDSAVNDVKADLVVRDDAAEVSSVTASLSARVEASSSLRIASVEVVADSKALVVSSSSSSRVTSEAVDIVSRALVAVVPNRVPALAVLSPPEGSAVDSPASAPSVVSGRSLTRVGDGRVPVLSRFVGAKVDSSFSLSSPVPVVCLVDETRPVSRLVASESVGDANRVLSCSFELESASDEGETSKLPLETVSASVVSPYSLRLLDSERSVSSAPSTSRVMVGRAAEVSSVSELPAYRLVVVRSFESL